MFATQGGLHKQQDLPFKLPIRLNTGRFRCCVVPTVQILNILEDHTQPMTQCFDFFTSKINETGKQTIEEYGSNANTRLKIMQLIMLYSIVITFLTVFIGLMIEMVELVVIGVISFLVYILAALAILFHFKPAYFQMCRNWNDEVIRRIPGWIEEYKQQHCQPDWIVDVSQKDGTHVRLPGKMMFELDPPWFLCLVYASALSVIPLFVMVTNPCCMASEGEETLMLIIKVSTVADQQQQMDQAMEIGARMMSLNTGVTVAGAPAPTASPPASQVAGIQAQIANLDPSQQQSLLASLQAMQKGGVVPSGVQAVGPRSSEGVPSTREGLPSGVTAV